MMRNNLWLARFIFRKES